MADNIKFALAVALVIAGVAGFYLLSGSPAIFGVLSVLAGLGAGAAVAWQTESGQRFFAFGKDAWTETKKVAWPTRKETVQTTGIIFAFVVIMALFLWITDKSLEWALYDLVLGWKKI
ncbi:MAG: preprotein translocase subunit SecE [Rhodocyclaceae bacterium]|nr:preprotein translocase subunit SecE [Rhodocyclaceae bacterium]